MKVKIKKLLLNYPILFSINFAIILGISHLLDLQTKLETIYYIGIFILSFGMYYLERSLLEEKFEPKTIEKLIENSWKENKAEKLLKKN